MSAFDYFRKKPASNGRGAVQADLASEHATRHCFVLCRQSDAPNISRASETVAKALGRGYSAETDDNGIVTVNCGQQTVGFLAHVPAPIPNAEAAENAAGNFLWVDGEEEAAMHRSHVIVTNIGGGEQSPVESALAVSRLTLLALELFDGLGVYWGNASVSNSRETFESFCEGMTEEHLPLPVWLRFQVTRASENELGLYTLGMRQFGLMDVEVDCTTMALEDLFEFVANLAHYLVQSGPVIQDGNTVGGNENERILVRHLPSMIDKDKQVYKVVFEGHQP